MLSDPTVLPNGTKLNSLLYADDLIIFYQDLKQVCKTVRARCLLLADIDARTELKKQLKLRSFRNVQGNQQLTFA